MRQTLRELRCQPRHGSGGVFARGHKKQRTCLKFEIWNSMLDRPSVRADCRSISPGEHSCGPKCSRRVRRCLLSRSQQRDGLPRRHQRKRPETKLGCDLPLDPPPPGRAAVGRAEGTQKNLKLFSELFWSFQFGTALGSPDSSDRKKS